MKKVHLTTITSELLVTYSNAVCNTHVLQIGGYWEVMLPKVQNTTSLWISKATYSVLKLNSRANVTAKAPFFSSLKWHVVNIETRLLKTSLNWFLYLLFRTLTSGNLTLSHWKSSVGEHIKCTFPVRDVVKRSPWATGAEVSLLVIQTFPRQMAAVCSAAAPWGASCCPELWLKAAPRNSARRAWHLPRMDRFILSEFLIFLLHVSPSR